MQTPKLLSGLVALILCSTGWAAQDAFELYVSPDGSDENSGVSSAPFKTIARAQQAVRQHLRQESNGDVMVLIRGGTYSLDEPLVFGPEDGGTGTRAVVYKAFPGEQPIISGGQSITGFSPSGQDEWTVELADVKAGAWWFRQLFVDGKRQVRARFPNGSEMLRVTRTSPDVKQITFDRPLPGSDTIGPDAELVVLQNWCITRAPLASATADSVTATIPAGWIGHGGQNTTWTITSPGKAAFLEHARAFLDSPGEWHLDRATGRLTYRSRPGMDPNESSVVASRLPKLLVVGGQRGNPVRNLHFEGLTFAHTEWALPEFGYVGIQAGHHGTSINERVYVLPAAVELAYAQGCGLQRCRILHTAASGIGIGAGCRENVVNGCEVADVGGNGIMVGLRADREFTAKGGDAGLMAEWTDPADIPAGNTVTNCYVHHAAATYSGCVGIYDAFCRETRIANNQVSHLPYTGISIGFRWDEQPTSQQACRVEYNHVYDVMKVLADGGAIYTLGYQPGTVLRGNLLHDVHRSEYAHGGAPNNGIFFDQGSKGYLLDNNIIYAVSGEPIRFNMCTRENLTWNNNSFGVDSTDEAFPHDSAAKAGLEREYQPLVTERLMIDDSFCAGKQVQRFGSVVGVKKEKLEEYKRLHARTWPGVLKMIEECNFRNFSIYLTEMEPGQYYLFSYLEYVGDDLEADSEKLKADPISRRWWTFTDPCQYPIPSAKEGELWHSMEEVFHTE